MQLFLIIVLSISTHSLLLFYALSDKNELSLSLALALALSTPPSPASPTQARAGNNASHLLLLAETGS
jgi:hypothetical protein